MEQQIRDLIAGGFTVRDTARILGMNAEVVRRKVRELGLTASRTSPHDSIYGLTDKTLLLRTILGGYLVELREQRGNYQPDISALTGLNARELGAASWHPYKHDWTLSQIERTLKAVGKELYDLSARGS